MIKKKLFLVFLGLGMFFIAWTPPYFFEMFPPKNVKKVTQILLRRDGTEDKNTHQVVREFNSSGQLIKSYFNNVILISGKDSIQPIIGIAANLNAESKVVNYYSQGGGDDFFTAVFYNSDNSISYVSVSDSSQCFFDKSRNLLKRVTYSKLREEGKIAFREEFHYNAQGRITEELIYIKNSFGAQDNEFPHDSLLLEEKNRWAYIINKKSKQEIGYKLVYNKLLRVDDTIEKRVFNVKNEFVKTVNYWGSWAPGWHNKDSVCFIYKYEYY